MATGRQPLLQTLKSSSSHRKTVCLIISFIAIIGSTALIASHLTEPNTSNLSLPKQICENASERESCLALVSELVQETSLQTKDLVSLLQFFLRQTTQHIQKAIQTTNDIKHRINDPKEQAALHDCEELLDLSMDRVLDSTVALRNESTKSYQDKHAWLSAILTNHVTCLDELTGSALVFMETRIKHLISRARTSLAMFVAISPPKADIVIDTFNVDLPSWMTRKDRKLLQLSAKDIKADVVVAKDGSGKFKTVQEAADFAPNKSSSRFIIYIKKGTYEENVSISKKKKNLMLVGDGMDSTVITGSLNVVDGSTTFRSATVAAVGDGFIAQDIWFQNTAGPEKHQAVALRVGADQSVINRCRVDAFQDTLYAHSNRQFYRDCFIAGTIDFIFGNAAAVLQNCTLEAKKPMSQQNNMVTAQGRIDPNQNTGTSIQYCNIIASSDLEPVKGTIRSYLGRPWKSYSRTVVMESTIDDHIDPAGWSPWSGDFALKTLYYGEYMNSGPGAGTSKRVNWTGYHVITDSQEASKFTVAELIQGGEWLGSTGVAFTEGL